MNRSRFAIGALFVLAAVSAAAFAAGVAGKWTAAIDTQIGVQNYTYDFKVDGEKLTFQDMPIRIVYTGTISGDEIKFNRKVGDFASEDFVAKRARQPGSHGNRNSY